MKTISAFVLLIAGIACAAPSAMAEISASPNGQASKVAPAKKTPATKKHHEQSAVEKEPDVSGLQPTAFDCELGNKLTIYSNAHDDQQIAMHWNKRMHHMTRVSTTTGAHRFENAKNGLVWIGIPAKGMLLDSKKGKQLANECKNAEQEASAQSEKG